MTLALHAGPNLPLPLGESWLVLGLATLAVLAVCYDVYRREVFG
ncbi:hypothetical protein [Halosegnis marinus]|uniref:Uncharacterized protein n=1 Tax=Halosegnis marinus TaxID=3034023 RepID=A0ABD5ZJL8_9EURY|nr:hypothetical protein [Halosegnis sp. DT85]